MDIQAKYPDLPYDPLGLHPDQRRFRVDPKEPLPSSFPPSQDSSHPVVGNGVSREPSKKRRPTGSGSAPRYPEPDYHVQPPTAPEVPKAPPLSYRAPQSTVGSYGRSSLNHPASFAERARSLANRDLQNTPQAVDPRVDEEPPKRERRASLNRPIGGVYSEIQQHRRDSHPPATNGATSSRRSSLQQRTSPSQPASVPARHSEQPRATALPIEAVSPPSSQSTAKPISPADEPRARKEWAPDRSPLQKLEVKLGDISKEEKRARVERAEQRLRRSKAGSQRESRTLGVPDQQRQQTTAAAGLGNQRNNQDLDPAGRTGERLDPLLNGVPPISSRQQDYRKERLPVEGSHRRSRVSQYPTTAERDNDPRKSQHQPASDPANQREPKPPQERGVRFQPGETGNSSNRESIQKMPPAQKREQSLRELDLDPKSAEVRAAKREQLRPTMGPSDGLSRSKNVPNETYQNRTSQPQGPVPVRDTAIQTNPNNVKPDAEPTSKYEMLPPTTAGIAAQQKVGFSKSSTTYVPPPTVRKHHFSNLLHRHHEKDFDAHAHPQDKPQSFDDWRRAGVARLTANDFLEDREPAGDRKAWWENDGSQRRRRSQRESREIETESSIDQTPYQGNNGEISVHSTSASSESFEASETNEGWVQHARPYVRSTAANYSASGIRFRAPLLKARLKRSEAKKPAPTYSYSCPELAYHNPQHSDHVCEPDMNKELTLSMRSIRIRSVPGVTTFNPPLYLKCGPLLRYTGMRRDKLESPHDGQVSVRETWRGSVMIVTADSDSTYTPVPVLRLFPEPMELVPPPPEKVDDDNRNDLPSEFVDPIAGLPKLSRTGKTVYVKPVDDLGEGVDLSYVETDDGLFEETRTAAVPTSYGTPDYKSGRNSLQAGNTPLRRSQTRKPKRGHRVRGIRLHTERGVTFWRFNLEVELGEDQARIAYSINSGPAVGFWVPAKGQSMNVMFQSCNGFSLSVNPDDFAGPDPLWRDVLNSHQTRPFHVMIGGGDQIYNDAVMSQSPLFRQWLETKNPRHKHEADFTASMQEEIETFYLEHYSMWFSQGLFGMANSQIPMVNIWDDHDIIDGFGSYPDHFMSTPIFCGIGAVAFKYYMLFQHQSVPGETSADEPSWLLGAAPGPYITEQSRSVFVSLGKNLAFLGLDCRTERMRDEILSQATYDLVFERCRREIIKGETKHLIVLLGVPIAYPRLVWLENLLTSRVMDPVKALGRVGLLGNFLNKFDGGVEILDDLDDHWTAKSHKQERNWFVQELQELAADLSVRVTILGGDVHLAAVGQFYSNPKLRVPKDHDHRYMANIVSSAIVNTPPPEMMGDILNKRNKTHHLDPDTDENMIPMFSHDVDGKSRNNKRLLPRRNWCSIREYYPGSTPPPSPPPSEPETESEEEGSPPPVRSRIQRTMSLTRGDIKPGNLIRRLSGRGPPVSYVPPASERQPQSPSDFASPDQDDFLPRPVPRSTTAPSNRSSIDQQGSAPLPRPGAFHRMPTNFSEKAVIKGDVALATRHVNLEHGLDIVLNCEVNQRDPAGTTTPYRLLIPALWYEGSGDVNTLPFRKRSVLSRLGSFRERRRSQIADRQGQGNWGQESMSGSETDEELDERPRRWSFGLTQRRQYRDQTPPSQRELKQFDGHDDDLNFRQSIAERPQQQRRFEDRNQQIGTSANAQASRMQTLAKLTGQHDQVDGSGESLPRRDSLDYHEHITASHPQQQMNGRPQQLQQHPPMRRLSKINRMLGGGADHPHTDANTDDDEEYGDEGRLRKFGLLPFRRTMSQGYYVDSAGAGGADGYADKRRSWRRFFS